MKLTFISLLLIWLRLGAVTPLQHTTSVKKWDLLLKTIGAKDLEVVRVTEDKIIIKTDKGNLKNLRNLLASKETLQKNTMHALFCNNPSKRVPYSIFTINVKDNDWFKTVVSDEFIRQNKLTVLFDALKHENIQFDEELLTSTLQFTAPGDIPFLMLQLSLTTLQSAITDEKALINILTGREPPITAHSNQSPSKYAKVISKIVTHKDNYTIDFVINNGAFAQAFQSFINDGEAPIIASNLNGLFTIDKQHLMKYFTPLFNGLIFSETEKAPIVFHAKQPEYAIKNISHDINMVIDTSGSMSNNFADYIINIKKILDKLGNIPNWQIQMVQFSNNSFVKFFSSKKGDSIADVKNYVDTYKPDGTTRLYCTVEETLASIKTKFANALDLYSTLMIFTDGDNTEGCSEQAVFNAASYLKNIPQFNMYAIGFGVTQSGFQKFFKSLTEAGGFVHIKLEDPNAMSQLQQYIDVLSQKINIWEVVQGDLKLSVSRVPEGDVFVLDPATNSNAGGITFVKNNKDQMRLGTSDINC